MYSQRPIVDVEAEVDNARECNILRCSPNLRIRKEEGHRHQRTNNHGVLSSQPGSTHPSCQYRAPDTTKVYKRVVAPRNIWASLTKLRSTRSEIGRQEHIVQRVGEAYERPGEPDESGADADTFC